MKTTLLVSLLVGGCATGASADYRTDVEHCFIDRSADSCNSLARTFATGSKRAGVDEDFELAQALAKYACRLWPNTDKLPKEDTGLIPLDSTQLARHPECAKQ